MTRRHEPVQAAVAAAIPHSFPLSEWTERASVLYPGSTAKAKYLVRTHKTELVEAGALARIGRDLIVFGQPYAKWLARKASRVHGFEIAANRARNEATA
jgi:hypothetical protein